MPNFERFDNDRVNGFRKDAVIATLFGDIRAPYLLLGSELVNKGFDVSKRYVLLWDAKTLELGLEPPEKHETGFKVSAKLNQKTGFTSYSIKVGGFCTNFGITDRMKAVFATVINEETWVLKMQKVK